MKTIRGGLSLVEVLVAVVVMGVASSGLAAVTFWLGRRAVVSSGSSARAAVVIRESDFLATLPYDSLPGRVGCKSVDVPPFPYDECVTVTDVAPGSRRVLLVITPRNKLVRPDSVRFDRSVATPHNPFY